MMSTRSSLTEEQRRAAVALFAQGYGRDAVATRLGVSRHAVRTLHDRWRLRGAAALETMGTQRQYSVALKRAVVERCLAGEPAIMLAQEYGVSSPALVKRWVRRYRAEGAAGLEPKPIGRPPQAPGGTESELERLRRENERLRAEVAYLGKLKALMSRERR